MDEANVIQCDCCGVTGDIGKRMVHLPTCDHAPKIRTTEQAIVGISGILNNKITTKLACVEFNMLMRNRLEELDPKFVDALVKKYLEVKDAATENG